MAKKKDYSLAARIDRTLTKLFEVQVELETESEELDRYVSDNMNDLRVGQVDSLSGLARTLSDIEAEVVTARETGDEVSLKLVKKLRI